MIKLTKLDKTEFYLNPLLIEQLTKTPDTVIMLNNGKRYLVQETVQTVVRRIYEFWRTVYHLEYKPKRLEDQIVDFE